MDKKSGFKPKRKKILESYLEISEIVQEAKSKLDDLANIPGLGMKMDVGREIGSSGENDTASETPIITSSVTSSETCHDTKEKSENVEKNVSESNTTAETSTVNPVVSDTFSECVNKSEISFQRLIRCSNRVLASLVPPLLTAKQKTVLYYLVHRKNPFCNTTEISRELDISIPTLRSILRRLKQLNAISYRRYQVNNRKGFIFEVKPEFIRDFITQNDTKI